MEPLTIKIPRPIIEAAEGGIHEKGQAYQALSELFQHRKCTTMANQLIRASEGDSEAQSYFQRLMDSCLLYTSPSPRD